MDSIQADDGKSSEGAPGLGPVTQRLRGGRGGAPDRSRGSAEPFLYALIVVLAVGVFVSDVLTPLGIGIWILYLVPLVLTFFCWSPLLPPMTAVLVTGIMIAGFELSPSGHGHLALLNRTFGVMTLWFLSGVGYFFIKNKVVVRREEWLQSGRTGLSEAMTGEQPIGDLGAAILRFLAEYVDAQAGALYAEVDGSYLLLATYGVPAGSGIPERFGPRDGLLGQATDSGRTLLVREVPEGYLCFGSALGRGAPRQLVIAPVCLDRSANGVIELGFVQPVDRAVLELIDRVSESIGVAIRSAHYRTNLGKLLDETRRQAETLQLQGEELRVSNEELEEQGRILKESQTRLEQQHAELEQTNAQLEEQAELLERQRDDLSKARRVLEKQTRELEQASRYKSEFLANMSHELRTPLNSLLILAKLLADNPIGNLNEEQIKYARTIESAGNDLLNLINDILDLSKIEAGHMELRPEPVELKRMVEGLSLTFEPMAGEKGLEWSTRVAPDCPGVIETDRQRLEQVLKNLLSNAMKFTERGSVSLDVSRAPGDHIAFAVSDTGIGIPEHQRGIIFQAFRQSDGASNRKHGGTGLGLSISQELARLLGGKIQLESEVGRGSVFTVALPVVRGVTVGPSPAALAPPPAAPPPAPLATAESAPEPIVSIGRRIDDDRDRLTGSRRLILVVEDDESFARILYELAHEQGFQCLIATTAEEAIEVASRYLPSAVVLDVGLPDYSGLSVLDRLKHDTRTRHIPVHVISGTDSSQTALSLGAASYLLKPVARERLVEELRGIESRLAQQVRRVLLVEDDPVQLDSLQKLLGSQEVETVGVNSAGTCLERLREETFDCMVLDLSLPDASGYELLETLSREDSYSFPPVIVYTGRDLSNDEVDRLRRYSQSIIIKGAKSPERLLDEVTLFLHQVVSDLTPEQQRMLVKARSRDAALEGRRILVVEDDVRNVFALTSVLEPRGAHVQIARNGLEAIGALEAAGQGAAAAIDLVLMDVMMPEMDGITATREIRQRPGWQKLPIIMLTAKAMKDDQERCLEAGANDYMAKPLDVEKLLSLVRVWMPR